MAINWFPGHMHKAQKEIREILPKIDVVIEVCDARLPFSSENPMLNEIKGNKPIIKILSKSDLADSDKTHVWLEYLESKHNIKAIISTTENKSIAKTLLALIKKLVPNNSEYSKTINALIMGIPNVGKSTLINTLVGKTKAKVGNEPAITKGQQRIQLEKDLYLFDTPGMLWPKITNENSAYRLAISGAVKDTAFEHDDIAYFAAKYLLETYPERLMARYQLEQKPIDEEELITAIGRKRGCARGHGRVDMHKASVILINEIRDKSLGAITFEMPEHVEQENAHFAEIESKKAAERKAKKLARSKARKNKR